MKKIYEQPLTEIVNCEVQYIIAGGPSDKMTGEFPNGDNAGIGDDIGDGEDVEGDAKGYSWDDWDV